MGFKVFSFKFIYTYDMLGEQITFESLRLGLASNPWLKADSIFRHECKSFVQPKY